MPQYELPDPTNPPSVQEERAKYGEEKPRAKDTARLIWASKPRKEPNPKDLEFQTAEEVYPNVADARDRTLSAYTTNGRKISEQPNRLIWGDNLLVMQALLAQGYEGQIDLIYIDPPFNTGENFNFSDEVKIGNSIYEKELPINERLSYTDTWSRGLDSFLDMLYPRIQLIHRLLSDKGSLYVHCDWRVNSYIRIILDEIFGKDKFVNEIVWKRSDAKSDATQGSHHYSRIQETIWFYCKGGKPIWNPLYVPLSDSYVEGFYRYADPDGRKYKLENMLGPGGSAKGNPSYEVMGITRAWRYSKERMQKLIDAGLVIQTKPGTVPMQKKYLDESKGVQVGTWWDDISMIRGWSGQKTGYPTQKPESLLERIINASSTEDSLVADFFCGSGTTGAVAERLGRKWIQSDISKTAVQVVRSRLVNQNAKPFLIENLGNYQRQLIYSKDLNFRQMYSIVLNLYGAVPRSDMQGFGISKEDKNTLVFVCEPDRAMTAKKAIDLAKLANTVDGKGYKKLVILAWDYDYEFDDAFARMKKNLGKVLSDVDCKIIPSDVYKYLRNTKVGDPDLANKITFYQKPYIRIGEPEIISRDGKSVGVKIRIEQYVIMDIPVKDESKRPDIEKCLAKNFAYLIDYWTIDWNYNGDVFRSQWQAIRDRRGDEPVPVLAETTLERGKLYTIAVRVVDVFGNDASGTKEIDLR